MSRKKRSYSLRAVRDNYSYAIDQVADLLGVETTTVQRWIRLEGLQRIPKTRPHLVHSSDLKAFLSSKKQARKQSCKEDELFCLKCRRPQNPVVGGLSFIMLPNASVRLQGHCSVCNCKINKTIKGSEWSKNHLLWRRLHDATEQHNAEQHQQRECQFQEVVL